jgi:hypothetical protein
MAAVFLEQARSEKTCINAVMMQISKPMDRSMLINLATEEPSKFEDLVHAAQAFQRLESYKIVDGEAHIARLPGYERAVQAFDNMFWTHVPMYVKAPTFADVKVDFPGLMLAVKNIAYCLAH